MPLDIMMSTTYHLDVRTTLTLDDDVATRLQAEVRRSGKPFKVVVNEQLRASFALRRESAAVPRFEVKPFDMGPPLPGVDLDNIGALLEQLEGPSHR
jgi:hypothetical protein